MLVTAVFTKPTTVSVSEYMVDVLKFWEEGIWSTALLEFAYQMMLILVLGHVLVLSEPISNLIVWIARFCRNTATSAATIACLTMLMAFFNWGLGLIFGALLARKVAEYAQQNSVELNYPIIGASGYVGLMVWHGGISGSALIKINEQGHLSSIMEHTTSSSIASQIPSSINFSQTVFSSSNLLIFFLVLLSVTTLFYVLGKKSKPTLIRLPQYEMTQDRKITTSSEKLDNSRILAISFCILVMTTIFFKYTDQIKALKITPNLINFFMLGIGILLHRSFKKFTGAIRESITDISGILIQFPLYFGIMGLMSSSGMVTQISNFFVSVASVTTLPLLTFFSAGFINIFVPSGGGQWVIQGPIVMESAIKLGVPLNKIIMALAYGDQITNMLQPFWALPLLGITKLKAKEILPYTLLAMLVGSSIFITGLLLLDF